jgi:hypothetical protein
MVIPNEGKILLLDRAMCGPTNAPEDYTLSLFKSNTTVVDASVAADFTPAAFTGSGSISIARSSLPLPTISAGIATTTRATAPSWANSGVTTETVYGWILVGATSGKLIAGQNFDAPRVMAPGSIETLDPFQFKLKTFA